MFYGIGEGLLKVCFDEEIYCNEKWGWFIDRFGFMIWIFVGIVFVFYVFEWVVCFVYLYIWVVWNVFGVIDYVFVWCLLSLLLNYFFFL